MINTRAGWADYRGLACGYQTIANVNKSILPLGVFPVNIRILKRIDLNFGLVISRLIRESFSETTSGWKLTQPAWNSNLQDKYNRYSSLTYWGLQDKVAYNFKLTKSVYISPQYLYYFGLTKEFVEFPDFTLSMRHYLCLGIKKKIK